MLEFLDVLAGTQLAGDASGKRYASQREKIESFIDAEFDEDTAGADEQGDRRACLEPRRLDSPAARLARRRRLGGASSPSSRPAGSRARTPAASSCRSCAPCSRAAPPEHLASPAQRHPQGGARHRVPGPGRAARARAARGGAARRRALAAAAIASASRYAALDELHQAFVPSRTASPRDVAVDAIGRRRRRRLAGRRAARSAASRGAGAELTSPAALGYASPPMRTPSRALLCCPPCAPREPPARPGEGAGRARSPRRPSRRGSRRPAPPSTQTEVVATYTGKKLTSADGARGDRAPARTVARVPLGARPQAAVRREPDPERPALHRGAEGRLRQGSRTSRSRSTTCASGSSSSA